MSSSRGFTLIELMVTVAIVGVLGTLAIPNYLRFQARAKQSEAKTNLRAIYTAEKLVFQETSTYACGFQGQSASCRAVLNWSPERGNRYAYSLVATPANWQTRLTAGLTPPASGTVYDGIGGDVFGARMAFSGGGNVSVSGKQVLASGAADAVTFSPAAGVTAPPSAAAYVAGPRGSFSVVAVGNIDSETNGIDKWFISSEAATVTAGNCVNGSDLNVAPGVPGSLYDDVVCNN